MLRPDIDNLLKQRRPVRELIQDLDAKDRADVKGVAIANAVHKGKRYRFNKDLNRFV